MNADKIKTFVINNKEILKKIVPIIVLMLFLIIGSTYAFFSMNISDSSTSTNVSIETGKLNSIAITNKIPEIHLNLKASDMSTSNEGTDYYATEIEDKPYYTENEDYTLKIAEITIVGEIKERHVPST